jgi:hypothetical protein
MSGSGTDQGGISIGMGIQIGSVGSAVAGDPGVIGLLGPPVPAWTPDDLGNSLGLWLRPEELDVIGAGNSISSWTDMSTYSRNATQAVGANMPLVTASVIDTLPGAYFDGVNDLLSTTVPNDSSDFSIFYVVNPRDATSDMLNTSVQVTASDLFFGAFISDGDAIPANTIQLIELNRNSLNYYTMTVDGVDQIISPPPLGTTALDLGEIANSGGGTYGNITLVELIYATGKLTADQRRKMFLYLNYKYPTLALSVPAQITATDPALDVDLAYLHDEVGLAAHSIGATFSSWGTSAGNTNSIDYSVGAYSVVASGVDSKKCFHSQKGAYFGNVPGATNDFEYWILWYRDADGNGGWLARGWDGGLTGLATGTDDLQWETGGTEYVRTPGTRVQSGNWFWARVVHDATGNNLELWLNGFKQDSDAAYGPNTATFAAGIGDNNAAQDHLHKVQMHFKIDRILTDAEANNIAAWLNTEYAGAPDIEYIP